ncbi:MAG: hypothetical protein ACK53L_19005, partial [Pirellulaceae bacterium]
MIADHRDIDERQLLHIETSQAFDDLIEREIGSGAMLGHIPSGSIGGRLVEVEGLMDRPEGGRTMIALDDDTDFD